MNKTIAQPSSKRLPGIFRVHEVIHGGTCVIKDLHNSGRARICCYYFLLNLFLNNFNAKNSNKKRLSFQFALMLVFYRFNLQTSMNARNKINAPVLAKNAAIPTEVIFVNVDQVSRNGHILLGMGGVTHIVQVSSTCHVGLFCFQPQYNNKDYYTLYPLSRGSSRAFQVSWDFFQFRKNKNNKNIEASPKRFLKKTLTTTKANQKFRWLEVMCSGLFAVHRAICDKVNFF